MPGFEFKNPDVLAPVIFCRPFPEIAAKTMAPFYSHAFSTIFWRGSPADRTFDFGRPISEASRQQPQTVLKSFR
jgi:hypothetical protein